MADSDGFTTVVRGSKRCARTRASPPTASVAAAGTCTGEAAAAEEGDLEGAKARLRAKVAAARQDVREQGYMGPLLDVLRAHSEAGAVEEVVCYGIGSFLEARQPRCQLAALLELREALGCERVHLFEPLLSATERSVLADMGLQLIATNECGRRRVECRTLFFMPHCCLPLYDNLLWANWAPDRLSHLLVLGNSFDGYEARLGPRHLRAKARYVAQALAAAEETPIPNAFQPESAFNDMALHTFPPEGVAKVPSEAWEERPPPPTEGLPELISAAQ